MRSIFRADHAFVTPYSAQANLSIERLISKDVTARADYLFTRGIHLLRTRNINLLPPLTGSGGRALFGAGRVESQFDAIDLLESSAASTYHGLTLSVNKRLSDEFELMASYTFSKTIDDASDFDEQPQNPFNAHAERGLSRQDVRNRLVVNSLFDLPIGEDENDKGKPQTQQDLIRKVFGHIEAAPIFTLSSGRPVNVRTGTDEEHSGAYPFASRPAGFGRNTSQTPRIVNIVELVGGARNFSLIGHQVAVGRISNTRKDGRKFFGAAVTRSTDVGRASHHKTNLANSHFSESRTRNLIVFLGDVGSCGFVRHSDLYP